MDLNDVSITFSEAVRQVAIAELELLGQAQSLDPKGINQALKDKSALMVDSMETTVAVLFNTTRDEVHESIGHLDPAVVRSAMEKMALYHAEHGL